jgi:hypothetical protein
MQSSVQSVASRCGRTQVGTPGAMSMAPRSKSTQGEGQRENIESSPIMYSSNSVDRLTALVY